jgi:aminoglycoside 6'-N-acetyltransferase I
MSIVFVARMLVSFHDGGFDACGEKSSFVMYRVRQATRDDAAVWATLRTLLWPEAPLDDHAEEIEQYFRGAMEEPQEVLLLEADGGEIVGLAELSIRRQVPGCTTERVGFVEGMYVVPAWRHAGVARALLRSSKRWAREQGCAEFASDRSERVIVDRRFARTR